MKDYLTRVTRWLGYLIALLIIIAATLVSVGRLLTPYLNQHKADFEIWASQLLNAPVKIDDVRISWNGYAPQLTFSKVAILDKLSNKPNFDIRQIKINVKIIESLIHREPVLSYIKMSGMDLTVHSKKSAFNVAGFGDIAVADNLLGGVHEANEVIAWIVSQPALVLSDIHIIFYTHEGLKKSITLDELSLLNANTKHDLSGKGTLNQDIPTHVELAVSWQGDSLALEKVSANLYLYLEGISLPQWFKQQTWNNMQIKEGLGSAKIWLTWDKGQLLQVQTQCQLYHLNLYSLATQQTQFISRLSGHFGWRREGENQMIAGNEILIDLPHHLWPTTSFSLILPVQMNSQQNHFSLNTGYVDLTDVSAFAQSFGFVPYNLKPWMDSLKPSGEVKSLTLDFQEGVPIENNKITGTFNELAWQSWKTYPGVHGLSGMLQWNGKNGYLDVDTKRLTVTYPSVLESPVTLGNLQGRVLFEKDKNDTWSFAGKTLKLANDDLEINMNVSTEIPKNNSPKIDLTSDFTVKKANHLVHYFPLKIMEPDLARWLTQAFQSGQFDAGKLIIQGRLNEFPFDNKNGKFAMTTHAKDLALSYAIGWPVMKKINGTLQFVEHNMKADIQSGLLQGMSVNNTHIEIPYIGKPQAQIVLLNGIIEGNLAQGLQVIRHSPLKNKLNKEFSALQMTGPMQLKLAVNLPLKNPERTTVLGNMELVQGALSVPAWNLSVDNVNGVLHFTEQSIEAPQVTARLWGEPIDLQIHTERTSQGTSFVNLAIKGKLSGSVIRSFVQHTAYASVIQGGAAYQATLRLPQSQLAEPAQLTINTDLKGIVLDLPAGLGKKVNEVVPSKIIANIKQNKPLEIKWIYGTKLRAAAVIKNAAEGMQLYSAEIRLGDKGEAAFQTEPGILVSGEFDTLDWNVWKPYFANNKGGSYKDLSALFRGLDIRANKIIGLFQPINKVHLELRKSQNDYSLKIDSTEIAGVITLPLKLHESSIQAKFDRLHLAPMTTQPEEFDPATLPAMTFTGSDVSYQDKHLGQVSFSLIPIKEGVNIESLHLEAEQFNLSAKGRWLMQNKKPETQLEGTLKINNVAAFLSSWGSPTVNPEGSNGTMVFDLQWPGAIYSPSLAGLTGEVELTLSSGQIVNLDQATTAKMGFGRILNLLSLDSIAHALTFNFSNLTEKGYTFDSVKGHFTLKNGNAFTDSVLMDGSIARIEMSGRLGLAAKDYDIEVIVTPIVTGSIPVVAALAVNPFVGAAAWIVEKIAGKAVSSATTHKYKVTGTWEKPVWVDK